jgi:aquaporin Z
MSTRPGAHEVPRIEPRAEAGDSLRLHWPEYLMEAGESAFYLFSACTFATLLWHPASPVQPYLATDMVRRMLMGLGMGATIMAIVLSPWGKQSGAHFNPAVTFTFYRLRKMESWDAVFYCAAQFTGAVAGVALALLVLQRAPAHTAVHYAATVPGIYGSGVAFLAELVISFVLMIAVLFTSNHKVLAPYTHYFAAMLAAGYIAFESPLSGMSTNPARTFGPALYGSYWRSLWIYFAAPTLGMMAAAEAFLVARKGRGPFCAKLHHCNNKRCIFRHTGTDPTEQDDGSELVSNRGTKL